MSVVVPASTKVRPSRVKNLDTDRLRRRAAWLSQNKARLARDVDGPDNPGGRNRLAALAREMLTIEAELASRDASFETPKELPCMWRPLTMDETMDVADLMAEIIRRDPATAERVARAAIQP